MIPKDHFPPPMNSSRKSWRPGAIPSWISSSAPRICPSITPLSVSMMALA